MTWSEVIADTTLRNLPYKIELDEWGNVVMRPASNWRGMVKGVLVSALSQHKEGGFVSLNCVVATSRGIKVADVAWGSADFFAINKLETPYRVAPELCIEIVSPSNSEAEMAQKRELYFAKGAKEVWLCSEAGELFRPLRRSRRLGPLPELSSRDRPTRRVKGV